METLPQVSVVIPSHARAAQLARTLEALARQTVPAAWYEVLVVLDGAAPGAHPGALPAVPYALRVLGQPHRGSGAARNLGARHARAPLLLFLDDDMEAAPELLAEHLAAQRAQPGLVLGGFGTPLPPGAPLVARAVADWWAAEQAARERPGHRLTFRDCWSGNVSVPAARFHDAGGFDERFGVRASGTDLELGARLLAGGVPVRFVPAARAVHRERATYRAMRRRALASGIGHLLIVRRHPALLAALPVAREPESRVEWLAAPLRWRWPVAAEWAARPAWLLLALLDRMRREPLWHRLCARLQQHAYWCGVARETGGREGWRALARGAPGAIPAPVVTAGVGRESHEREPAGLGRSYHAPPPRPAHLLPAGDDRPETKTAHTEA